MRPIAQLKLDNWKGISSEIPLWPVTFLVGPNGGGKSSLLESLALISHLARRGTLREDLRTWLRGWPSGIFSGRKGVATIDVDWKNRSKYSLTIGGREEPAIKTERLQVSGKDYIRTEGSVRKFLGEGQGRALTTSNPFESALALFARSPKRRRKAESMIDLVTGIEIYALDADFLRGTAHDSRPLPYSRKGTSLVAGLIDAKRDSERWDAVLSGLQAIQPDLEDIETHERPRGVILKYRGGRISELDEESDGVVRAAGMFLVRYRRDCPAILGFDEPENGYHMSRLVEVVARLAPGEMSGIPGPELVIMATHSAAFVQQAVKSLGDRTGVISMWRSKDGTVVPQAWSGSDLKQPAKFKLMVSEAFEGR